MSRAPPYLGGAEMGRPKKVREPQPPLLELGRTAGSWRSNSRGDLDASVDGRRSLAMLGDIDAATL
jgi:hypothetical protein